MGELVLISPQLTQHDMYIGSHWRQNPCFLWFFLPTAQHSQLQNTHSPYLQHPQESLTQVLEKYSGPHPRTSCQCTKLRALQLLVSTKGQWHLCQEGFFSMFWKVWVARCQRSQNPCRHPWARASLHSVQKWGGCPLPVSTSLCLLDAKVRSLVRWKQLLQFPSASSFSEGNQSPPGSPSSDRAPHTKLLPRSKLYLV